MRISDWSSDVCSSDLTLVSWLAGSPELLEQAAEEFERAWASLGDRSVSLFRSWGNQNPNLTEARDGLLVGGFQKLFALNGRDPNRILALGDRTTLTVVDEEIGRAHA